MTANQLREEIKEVNLSYLLLAQQMIKSDRAAAIFRLGVSEDVVDLMAGLTPAQMLKMSSSNMLLCCFRLDEQVLLNMLTDYNRDRLMTHAHAAILMSDRPVATLVE